ncbi:MAG: hypothetical protein HGA59_07575 [Chlorobiaceae bacterium]|jgi:hypothetical protein|nr:hypothetical protein [Chlorobiaceae bacterium]
MRVTRPAAMLFTIVTAGVVFFQFALAVGLPLGSYAMGGAFPGVFPPFMRYAALFQAFLLVVTVLVVLSRSGVLLRSWFRISKWAIWLIVFLGLISVVLNSITPSAGEKAIWQPVSILLFACSFTVAITASKRPRL